MQRNICKIVSNGLYYLTVKNRKIRPSSLKGYSVNKAAYLFSSNFKDSDFYTQEEATEILKLFSQKQLDNLRPRIQDFTLTEEHSETKVPGE